MSDQATGTSPTRAALWDARHSAQDPIESADADPTVVEIAATLTPGTALDLGAGDGRNVSPEIKVADNRAILALAFAAIRADAGLLVDSLGRDTAEAVRQASETDLVTPADVVPPDTLSQRGTNRSPLKVPVLLRVLARLVLVATIAVAGLSALLIATSRRFGRLVDSDRRRMLDRPRPAHAPLVTEAMLTGLPESAQRYLRFTGVVGRPMVDTVRVRQACRMRPAPGGMSLPLLAEQWYSVEPPGFLWDATVPVAGVPVVRGRDGYLEGRGVMTIKVGSVVSVVDASGPEMDEASLLRYLSEMPWFPSAFLRDRVTWEAMDDATVRVSIVDGDLRATGTLRIDPDGRLVEFRSERHAMVGDRFELRPWSTPAYGYGEFEGLRLPVRGAAVWTMPDGTTFPYIDVELTDVAFDPTW